MRKSLSILGIGVRLLFISSAQGSDLSGAVPAPPRATVVIAENPAAVVAFQAQAQVVSQMVDTGIMKLSGKPSVEEAWRQFVSTNDIVGIKVYSGPGSSSGTRPAVAGAVVQGLLKAGLPANHIVIWDKNLLDLRLSGYDELAQSYHVQLAGAADAGFDPAVSYDNELTGALVAGDMDFDVNNKTTGRNSYVSKLLTRRLTKIINISPLLNHNLAGICGNLYSLAMGSVDNTLRFESSPERLARAVPEIYALRPLSDHVALNITDALIGQYQGEQTSLLHYAVELDQIWFSKDPVALDTLGIAELDRERKARKIDPGQDNPDLFHNASYFLDLGVTDPLKMRLDIVH